MILLRVVPQLGLATPVLAAKLRARYGQGAYRFFSAYSERP